MNLRVHSALFLIPIAYRTSHSLRTSLGAHVGVRYGVHIKWETLILDPTISHTNCRQGVPILRMCNKPTLSSGKPHSHPSQAITATALQFVPPATARLNLQHVARVTIDCQHGRDIIPLDVIYPKPIRLRRGPQPNHSDSKSKHDRGERITLPRAGIRGQLARLSRSVRGGHDLRAHVINHEPCSALECLHSISR
jgi:hypothetical protein